MAVAVHPPLTSAAGILSLLDEEAQDLRALALEQLNDVVDQFWAEAANWLADIEALHEDASFSHRELAALVASKVFYHLEEYGDALRLALAAGALFDVSAKSQYVECMASKAIEAWVAKRRASEAVGAPLESTVTKLFDLCEQEKNYKQAAGIAMDALELDVLERFCLLAEDRSEMVRYVMQNAQTVISTKSNRDSVLALLVRALLHDENADWSLLAECYFHLDKADEVAVILARLLKEGETDEDHRRRLLAYQIAFDVCSYEKQTFLAELLAHEALTPSEDESLDNLRLILAGKKQIELHLEFLYRANHTDLLLLDKIKTSVDGRSSVAHNAIVMAHALMQCGTTSDVFLRTNLDWLAKAVHWAKFTATASLGVIHKGHIDKESLSVLSTYLPNPAQPDSSPYSEGGALYALGLIHAHCAMGPEPKEILLNHLRGPGSQALKAGACLGSGLAQLLSGDQEIFDDLLQVLYSDQANSGEAAGFAIGLVMAGTGNARAISELMNYAHETQHEKIIRACAMGLALISLTREEEADALILQMTADKDAILRYGGMWAIGLAYCGTSSAAAIRQLLHFSVSDVSDDVRRAAVTSLAFVMCNEPKQLPRVLKLLSESYNPHVRNGAAVAIGIACAGRAATLPEAVALLEPLRRDSTNFVRQSALIATGLLYQQTSNVQTDGKLQAVTEELHKVLSDKHEDALVRFGAILAFGLVNAGGRNSVASMWNKGHVRLGGAIGLAMFSQMWYWFPLIHFISLSLVPTALIGLNERLRMPKNFVVRSEAKPSLYAYPDPTKACAKESAKTLAKATLSTAKARRSSKKPAEESGLKIKPPRERDSERASNSAASVAATMGSSVAETLSDKLSLQGVFDADTGTVDESMEGAEERKDDPMEVDEKEEAKEEKEAEKEATFEVLSNPCRVVPSQEAVIRYYAKGRSVSVAAAKDLKEEDEKKTTQVVTRYMPVNPERKSGFILVRDLDPTEAEDILEFEGQQEEEPKPPEPFDWSG